VKVGVMMHLTDHTVPPAVLAVEAEARGFDSMFVTEHTHVPVRPFIRWSGGRPMPDEYKRLHDPVVALATAAAVTCRIRLGTGVLVIGQRHPLALAKQLASLDRLSGGRLVVGTGYGWLRDELADHGVGWHDRRATWCEHLEALTTLWRDDEACFAGEHVRFGPVWSYPKPIQRPRPTVLLGAAGSDATLRDVVAHVDGWMPIEGTERIADKQRRLHDLASAANRPLDELRIVVYASGGDTATLDAYEALGIDEVIVALDGATDPRAQLDRHHSLIERYHWSTTQ
jgi:probable F420-dependent oxidoreductase